MKITKDVVRTILMTNRLNILEVLDNPFSLALAICERYGDYDSLLGVIAERDILRSTKPWVLLLKHKSYKGICPLRCEALYYFESAQAKALYSKNDGIAYPSDVNPDVIATEQFLETESHGRWVNEVFSQSSNLVIDKTTRRTKNGALLVINKVRDFESPLMRKARALCRSIMGEFPGIESFKPILTTGTTMSFKEEKRSVPALCEKLEMDICLSPTSLSEKLELLNQQFAMRLRAKDQLFEVTPPDWNYGGSFWTPNTKVKLRDHDIVGFVPKLSTESRLICLSADDDISIQRGVGVYLSKRLKKSVFINIANQADFHQRLVTKHWDSIATIDIRKASQTMYMQVVKNLVGNQWYDFLSSLRARESLLDNRMHKNQVFSAMGNGYTFELETIIFYCIAKAAVMLANASREVKVNDFVTVFGDDIIVASSNGRIVADALGVYGFSVNEEKTFMDGPFKESCGRDTYYGYNVRPKYCRNESIAFVKTNDKDSKATWKPVTPLHEFLVRGANRTLEIAKLFESLCGNRNGYHYRFRRAWLQIVPSKSELFSTCSLSDWGCRLPLDEKLVPLSRTMLRKSYASDTRIRNEDFLYRASVYGQRMLTDRHGNYSVRPGSRYLLLKARQRAAIHHCRDNLGWYV